MSHTYTEMNADAWDKRAENNDPWSIPVSHKEYLLAKEGKWQIFLTPCVPVPKEWFGDLKGKEVLGLASGGGQQMPILTARGAHCTVFDYSKRQLLTEKMVAEREAYDISLVRGDMTKPFPFPDQSFDLICHPVSNCYVEDVYPIWRECARVLKPGGILLAGFDNGANFLFEDDGTLPLTVSNKLPYNSLQEPKEVRQRLQESGEGFQFSHSLTEQIGGQLKAGFILTDLYEDRNPKGMGLIRDFMPQYIATRAYKK